MTTLIFDTETSALPNQNIGYDDPKQGRLMQLACLLLDKDFKTKGSFYSLVRLPLNVEIHPGAQNAHGITREDCEEYGITQEYALQVFSDFYNQADCIVAHNIWFDKQLIDIEETLIYGNSRYKWDSPKHICTMRSFTPIMNLPGGRNGQPKWPKLAECYQYCFNTSFTNGHDSMQDVLATSKIFRWLVESKRIELPKP